MLKKTLLFDLDGTLIDSTEAILRGFEYAFKELGAKTPKRETIRSFIGYPLDIMFEKLGIKEDIPAYVLAYKKEYERIYLELTTLLPQAKEAIELALSFADLAVVTTKTSRLSANLLEHLGVLKDFKVLIGREDTSEPKPSAMPILRALERLKKGKENAFMIGDTHLDINAALNAGITPLGVYSGYESKESLEKICKDCFKNAYEAVKFAKDIDRG